MERGFLEKVNTDNLQNCVEACVEIQSFLDNGHQDIDRNGDPDLGFDGVFGSAVELLDAKVLLDPLKEQLYLPPATIQLRDGFGRQKKIVGEVSEISFVISIEVANTS